MQRLSRLFSSALIAVSVVALQACGGGGGGTAPTNLNPGSTTPPVATPPGTNPPVTNPPTTSPPVTTPPPAVGQVQITGVASYESVTNKAGSAALDYANITTKPMRGILIAAVSGTTIVSSATTSDTGAYALNVPANSNVSIAVAALMTKTTGPANWNVGIYDNTDQGALWQIGFAAASAGSTNSVRNIKVPLGWNAATLKYDEAQRASGPFAILDTIYSGMQLVTSVAPTTQFPALTVFWSPKNTTVNGSRTAGEIGTSFFTELPGATAAAPPQRTLFILGKEDTDTDEFDSGVIAHEYGHYLQSAFSQSHSTGGAHSTGDYLDMTLSYGEGWGYAFASLVRNSPDNPDSSGPRQDSGGVIRTGTDPSTNSNASVGWFSESSVQYIIYKLGVDKGFAPIWASFSGPMKSGQDALNTIFTFAAGVRSAAAGAAASLNILLDGQKIYAGANADQWGTGETNNGGNVNNIPVHQVLTIGAAPVPLCFNKQYSNNPNPNKLGERRYLRFNNPAAGSRTITVSSTAANGHDVDFLVYQRGGQIGLAEETNTTSEVFTGNLPAGEVLIRAYDYNLSSASTTNCATIRVN